MQLRHAMDMNRYGPRALRNRMNKAGYHFHLIYKTRGKTDCSTRIGSALSILRGFPLNAWTGLFASDPDDYQFNYFENSADFYKLDDMAFLMLRMVL